MGTLNSLFWWLWGFLESVSVLAVVMTVLGFFIPITRKAISKYLVRHIDYGFDEQLEKLRSELRQAEEHLKSQLQSNENRIKAITDGALSTISNRHSVVEARRLKAVEAIWLHKAEYDRGKFIVRSLSAMKLDRIAQRIESEPKLQSVFKMYDNQSPLHKWKDGDVLPNLESHRPFLSPVVWGVYSAYRSLIDVSLLRTSMFAHGISDEKLLQPSHSLDLVKATLPELESFIDEYGHAASEQLLEVLDQKLLEATRDMLSGKEANAADAEFARRLMKVSAAVNTTAIVRGDFSELQANLPEDLRTEAPQSSKSTTDVTRHQ